MAAMTDLEGLLDKVASGDYEALTPLANLLEARGDPRAVDARSVMKPDPELIASVLRTYPLPKETPSPGTTLLTFLSFTLTSMVVGIPLSISFPSPIQRAYSSDEALRKVTEALANRMITSEIAQAMTLARRIKCDRLLEQFKVPGSAR
jgi:hypothetical protein